jgi:hypothetical protein
MSSKPNHRRGHGRIQERGSRWERANPAAGCNSTHVARSRRKWNTRVRRAERRTGQYWKKFFGTRYTLPYIEDMTGKQQDFDQEDERGEWPDSGQSANMCVNTDQNRAM